MNKVILMGRLTAQPELKKTNNGNSVLSFTIAVNRSYKNAQGNYDADFISCVAFKQVAEFISKYFNKGDMLAIDGSLQTRNYQAQDGTKRYVTEVMADHAEFCGGKQPKADKDGFKDVTDTDDKLPF